MKNRQTKNKLDSDLQEALKPWQRQPDEVKLDVLQSQAKQLLKQIDPCNDPCRRVELLQNILWRLERVREAKKRARSAKKDSDRKKAASEAINHTVELMKVVDDAGRSFAMAKGGMRSSRKRHGCWYAMEKEYVEQSPSSPEKLWKHFVTFHDCREKGVWVTKADFQGVVFFDSAEKRLFQLPPSDDDSVPDIDMDENSISRSTFKRYFYDIRKNFLSNE